MGKRLDRAEAIFMNEKLLTHILRQWALRDLLEWRGVLKEEEALNAFGRIDGQIAKNGTGRTRAGISCFEESLAQRRDTS